MECYSDLLSLERNMLNRADRNHMPLTGSIELLPLCNLKCDMCYVRLEPKEMDEQGHIRSIQEWLDISGQMKDAGVLFLLLTGGEPLLYPDFKELYLELKKMGMILTINTNGTLLNEEWAEFFSKHMPRRINITLYGSDSLTYERLCHSSTGFQRTMDGIRILLKHGIPVRLGCSAAVNNQKDIENIIQIGKNLGVSTIVDTYMMPATRERSGEYNYDARLSPHEAAKLRIRCLKSEMSEEEFAVYRQNTLWQMDHILPSAEPVRMTCHAGKSSFAINWQGKMRPCVIMTEPSMSVFEHGFQMAWEHIVNETEKLILCDKCSSCKLRPICRTCAACALLEAGSCNAVPEYMCRYAEESARQLELSLKADTHSPENNEAERI